MKRNRIYIYVTMTLLLAAMVVGVFAEPVPELSVTAHFAVLIACRAAGLAAGYGAYRLLKCLQAKGLAGPLDDRA